MKLYDGNNGWMNSSWAGTAGVKTLDEYQKHINERSGSRIGADTVVGSDYSVVGLNVNKIDNMCTVIKDYVKGIQDYLDAFNPSAISAQAFRGEEVNEAVKKYIEAVKKYCIDSTSYLITFCDKLKQVRAAYQENMQKLGSQIGSSESSFSKSDAYSEGSQLSKQ